MTTHRPFRKIGCVLIALAFTGRAPATDISTAPLNTYSAPSSTDVKPNVFFVLDDSGSMDWDFMPDWACAPFSTQNGSCSSTGQDPSSSRYEYLFRNSAYNGIYYNPAITYKPPVAVDSTGAVNTTTYPGMTGVSTATGGDATATSSSRNWKAVKDDAYGIQASSTSKSNLVSDSTKPPLFFTIVAGEYCTSPALRQCITANASSGSYIYPAKVRWCDSSALTNCRAAFSSTYSYVRAPSPSVSTMTLSGSSSTSVTGMTVNGQQIMASGTSTSSSSSSLAQLVANQINLCTVSTTGNCQVAGYRASYSGSGSVITLIAPSTVTFTPAVTKSGSMTISMTAFSAGNVLGQNIPTIITPSNNSYPYPGTSAKASTRTDCAGTTCTYVEEMTNYANWWTYYRTRMQMMKTAASNAFSTIDSATDIANNVSRFRLGYMSINNNTDSDFLNFGEFKGSQKYNWYTKLINANPGNSTPLRAALSKAGRLYAGKLDGTTFNGSTVTDPLQYSCQQNYTILSTDGFWNESSGYVKMDATTNVGNQDAGLQRPYSDGGSSQIQTKTSTLQSQSVTSQAQTSTSSLQQQTSQLQMRTSQLQKGTLQLQKRTSTNSGNSWTSWTDVTSCTWDNSSSTRTQCQYLPATGFSNVSSCTASQGSSQSNGTTWSSGVACQYTGWTSWAGTSSCTAVAQSGGPTNYTTGTARQCQTVATSPYANVATCTATTTPDASGFTTQCQYTAWSSYTNTPSCTAVPRSTSSPYTVGTATQCQTVNTTGAWTNASSCTASSTQNCQYTSWSAWANTTSCTPAAQSTGPNYTVGTARQCQTLSSGGTSNTLADVAAYYYTTDLRSPTASDGTGTCTGPVIAPATTPNDLCANNVPTNGRDVATAQHMTTFTLGLGSQGQMIYAPQDGKDYWNDASGDFYDVKNGTTADPSTGVCSWQSSGTCTWPTPVSNSNANIDDLWHAAINGHGTYFSATDPTSLANSLTSTLMTIANTPRPGTAAAAASSNPNVSSSDNLVFSSSYKSVEWYGELIRQKIRENGTLTGQNWSAMRLLDCATTPWTPSTSYVAGNVYRQGNTCYTVINDYVSGTTFDSSSTGTDLSNTMVVNVDETANQKVPVVAPTSRTIYTKGAAGLISFDWTNMVAAGLGSYFTTPAISYVSATSGLSQFCSSGGTCLSNSAQTNNTVATGGAAGEALVNFLRGDRTNEGTFYRKRTHVLSDIVSAEARYVKVPLFNYSDGGYADFKKAMGSRKGVVYVSANDGMLHAFDADTGQELWAYIPSLVLPNLYKLADKNYATQHQFFVDGTPEVGDICPNAPSSGCDKTQWKTILVGGLNLGGKGYYALDITNPSSPVLLWEFTNANLGYSYGNPKLTKLKDGTWVVLLSSGYNNADGLGHLYVLNAKTGSVIRTINTTAGTAANPSGLARISAHVTEPMTDNTTVAAYGGDTLGNLWRFDVNGDIGVPGYDAQLLISFTDSNGHSQPITVKPLEATINNLPVVFVGTGRYLGTSDVGDSNTQSFYAVKDKLDSSTYGDPRIEANGFVHQTVTSSTCPADAPLTVCSPGQVVRMGSNKPVDWKTQNGWFLDFVTPGERSVSDPSLGLGTLIFTTIIPQSSSASACGDPGTNNSASFVYWLDYLTGSSVLSTNDAGQDSGSAGDSVIGAGLGAGLATRPILIELPNGTVKTLIRTSGVSTGSNGTAASGGDLASSVTVSIGVSSSTDLAGMNVGDAPLKQKTSDTRRVSWRVLTN